MAAVSQAKLNINSRQIPRRSLQDLPSFFNFRLVFELWRPPSRQLPPVIFELQAPAKVMCDTIRPIPEDLVGPCWTSAKRLETRGPMQANHEESPCRYSLDPL
jgi:hypothetical protein